MFVQFNIIINKSIIVMQGHLFLMCLWYMRMRSIYNGAQGHPGGDESFANGQYCIYTKRSGSTDMNFPEVVCYLFRGQKSSIGMGH